MKRGILIYNPRSGSSDTARRIHAIIARATARDIALEPRETSAPGDATRIVLDAFAGPPDLIVAAGGDGTIAEVATGLVGSEVPLALLPYGTANVLAREFGASADPERALRVLASSRTRPLTAWLTDRRACFMWVGVGFDARMLRAAHSGLKRVFGRVGIGFAGLNEFLRYDFPELVVEGIDEKGAAFTREATYVVAANIQRYGGDMKLAPQADASDDLIDLVLFTGRTHAELARYLFDIGTGAMERGDVANVSHMRARSATIRTKSGKPEHVLIDGDDAGETPIDIGPIAGHVQVLIPE